MDALLFTVGKAFCCQSLSEASFNLEHLQLSFYLATNHHDKSVAKHQQAIGNDKRIFVLEPLVKFMLLGKDMPNLTVLGKALKNLKWPRGGNTGVRGYYLVLREEKKP